MVGSVSTLLPGRSFLLCVIVEYSYLFYCFIYIDILIGIWNFCQWSDRFRHLSVLLFPALLLIRPYSSFLVVILLGGFLTEFLLYHCFPFLQSCFSIAEIILLTKYCILFLFLLFGNRSDPVRITSTIVIESTILSIFALILYSCKPSLFWLFSLIVAGAGIEIASLSSIVSRPFIPWFIEWIFEWKDDSSFSLKRIFILCSWFLLLTVSILSVNRGILEGTPLIIQRKYFHLLAVILFLPISLIDPDLMQFV